MINKYSVSKAASIMKKTRKEMGKEYTQEKMAELLKLKNRQSYANFENGHTLPNWEQILELCNIFECDIGYLVGEYTTKKHMNANIQEVTGLSEKAINKLSTIVAGRLMVNVLKQLVNFQDIFTDVDLINLLFDSPAVISKMKEYFILSKDNFAPLSVGVTDQFTFDDLLNYKLEGIKDALRECRNKSHKQ